MFIINSNSLVWVIRFFYEVNNPKSVNKFVYAL